MGILNLLFFILWNSLGVLALVFIPWVLWHLTKGIILRVLYHLGIDWYTDELKIHMGWMAVPEDPIYNTSTKKYVFPNDPEFQQIKQARLLEEKFHILEFKKQALLRHKK